MEEERQVFVETWTKTRDKIIKENTEAENTLSETLSKLSAVSETVNEMNSEVAGWKDNIAQLALSYGQEKQSLISTIENKTEELGRIENQIIKENQALEIKKIERKNLSDDLEDMNKLVTQTKTLVTNVITELPNFTNSVKILLAEFASTMNDVKVSVNYFKDELSAVERQQNDTTNKQNIRENYLIEREKAITNSLNNPVSNK